MKNKRNVWFSLIIVLAGVINFPVQAQQKNGALDSAKTTVLSTSEGPKGIVRTIKQDRKGNIWITSWEGVFKYDGKSFTNVTSKVSSARFFSVLEDRKGNFWFASIGSGVYYYDASLADGVRQNKSFRNFTTKDGLADNSVTNIYEDKSGNIWFGTASGVSHYDGKSFWNLQLNETSPVTVSDSAYIGPSSIHSQTDSVRTQSDSVYNGPQPTHRQSDSVHLQSDSVYNGPQPKHSQSNSVHLQPDSVRSSFLQSPLPAVHWTHNDVNAIIEDNTGKFWFGTRGYAKVYDGKKFTTITNSDGKPFLNVRSIITDKKGNIWLGGNDGLWRYDGSTFTNLSHNFVGYIYEDKKGNLWISSGKDSNLGWTLSRFDEKSLSTKNPTATTIANKPMIFGILEDNNGNIWFGAMDGVYRYDGKTITDFRSKEKIN